MPPLPQLVREGYEPNTFLETFRPREALAAAGAPTYPAWEDWLAIFADSIAGFAATAAADPAVADASAAAARFAAAYRAELVALPPGGAGAGCLELCAAREAALVAAGFADAFLPIKKRENAAALALLPEVLAEADATPAGAARWALLLRSACAANVFDLGAAATAAMYAADGGVRFHATRDALLPRPWTPGFDNLDALVGRLAAGPPHARAVLFLDNAGADALLGMLPLARELARRGAVVVLAANSAPAINDITAAELDALLPAIAAADDVLCKAISERRIVVVASGSGLPVIDLSKLSEELVAAAAGADLVLLDGMGRSIETNLRARFSCDAVCVGMVKHPEVAAALGARMLDCVVRFTPADGEARGGARGAGGAGALAQRAKALLARLFRPPAAAAVAPPGRLKANFLRSTTASNFVKGGGGGGGGGAEAG